MIKMWNLDSQTSIVLDYKSNVHRHSDFITAMGTGCLSRRTAEYQVHYEYLFATGYDARISIWEIAQDNHHPSASISPQLKAILFTDYPKDVQVSQAMMLPTGGSTVGKEILALVFYESHSQDTPS